MGREDECEEKNSSLIFAAQPQAKPVCLFGLQSLLTCFAAIFSGLILLLGVNALLLCTVEEIIGWTPITSDAYPNLIEFTVTNLILLVSAVMSGVWIRERIRQAREEARLSQRQMADLLSTTQASISDIERGRVQVNIVQLRHFADILKKPITYFLPPGAEAETEKEAELLKLFRSVPEHWQNRILQAVEIQVKLHRRIQPYEDADVPDEFYEHLLFEELEQLELEESATAGEFDEPGDDYLAFRQRYDEWKTQKDQELKKTAKLH